MNQERGRPRMQETVDPIQKSEGELTALGGVLWGKRRHRRISDVMRNSEKDLGYGKEK